MSRKTDFIISRVQNYLLRKLHPLEVFFIEINTICNLHCKHCYIPSSQKQEILPFKYIEKSLDQIYKKWGNSVGIAITGGEPLLHPEFKKIAEMLWKYKYSWSLATNGILLNEEMIKILMRYGCNTMTISIDGDEKAHNIQRDSKTAFSGATMAIERLMKNKFPNIYVTSTIHRDNVDSLKYIYKLISQYRNNLKWRINPLLFCESTQINNLSMDTKTYQKIVDYVKKVYANLGVEIKLGERSAYALKYGESPYSEFDLCTAGINTFGVLANGDIVNCMVCRNEKLGSIYKDITLEEIWDSQNLYKKGLCERHFESKNSKFRTVIK